MATKIGWTDETWNPFTGCNEVSTGCKHCYARVIAERNKRLGRPRYENGFEFTVHKDKLNKMVGGKPKMVFVNSMSDLFHEKAPFDDIDLVFDTMHDKSQHIYQILTKRPDRMKSYVQEYVTRHGEDKLSAHIWLGVSVENQSAMHRVNTLAGIRATTRFISFEPLLGPISFEGYKSSMDSIRWAIIGGESGKYYRKMEPAWAEGLLLSLKECGVHTYFKQWGGLSGDPAGGCLVHGLEIKEYPKIHGHPMFLGGTKC